MTPDDPRHGSHGGYLAHNRLGEDACQPCLDAHAAYVKQWRRDSVSWRRSSKARSRALTRLRQQHPADFDRLYIEELNALRREA